MSVYVIAEAGVNHNGDVELASQLVDAAVEAGADAVKFQTFQAEELAAQSAIKATYQKQTTDPGESQLDMLRKLELSVEAHRVLKAKCESCQIDFLSTPFDLPSLEFLVDEMSLETLKIPSGEITNGPLLLTAAQSGCRIILSTGMSTLDEVRRALGVLSFGMLGLDGPSQKAFDDSLASDEGRDIVRKNVTVLHCTSQYPAAFHDVNLTAMKTLRQAFGTAVGYSDHTTGTAIAIAAAALGAEVIEKHFTLDRALPGPDHKASLEPLELKDMVSSIRAVESALGNGEKVPCDAEFENMAVARKSLVAVRPIAKGDRFTNENLGIKRPGTGISPMTYWEHLGSAAQVDYQPDDVIAAPGSDTREASP